MLSLLFFIFKFIPNILNFLQHRDQTKLQAAKDDMEYQIEFLKTTSNIEATVVRQLIVISAAVSIFAPIWVAIIHLQFAELTTILQTQVSAVPWQYWFFLFWEFIGKDALYLMPWFRGFKNGNHNGDSASDPTTVPDPNNSAPGRRDAP